MSFQLAVRPLGQNPPVGWSVRSSRVLLLLVVAFLQACAAVPYKNPRDPMESWNRGVFSFNDTVDRAVVKPVATAYQKVLPQFIRTGISNFFNNIDDVWSVVNNALQLRGQYTADSFGRVMVNSTMGIGGLFDIASEMGMERRSANFGLTLGTWGVGPGPFVVLPFLGLSTLRDTLALPIDRQGNVVNALEDVPTRDALVVLSVIDLRAGYLKAGDVIEGAALDKYSFTRDAYLQRRRNQVYDGNPPDEDTSSIDYVPAAQTPTELAATAQ